MNRCHSLLRPVVLVVLAGGVGLLPAAAQTPASRLILYGDMALFAGPGKPDNCILKSRYKIGEPVGFRMTAIDGSSLRREKSAQLAVHLTYPSVNGPKNVELPMRDFQTEANPEREFFVAKWIIPNDAAIGIVRYTVRATDQHGRTAEWKPFPMENAMLTIVP